MKAIQYKAFGNSNVIAVVEIVIATGEKVVLVVSELGL